MGDSVVGGIRRASRAARLHHRKRRGTNRHPRVAWQIAQTMPLTVAAQNATRGPQWWYMSVLIQIMILPVIALAIGLERIISRGLLVGAVKG